MTLTPIKVKSRSSKMLDPSVSSHFYASSQRCGSKASWLMFPAILVSCKSVQTSIQTLTLCPTWRPFAHLGVKMGSLDPTHKPLYDTITWELSVAVGWVVLVDARPGPCQRAAADWYPVLRGFGRQMLAGKSPFVKCVAEYVKKLGNCVLPHECEQKFGKAAREAIKYWSGYHFSSPNTVLCFPFLIFLWHHY